MNMQVFVKRRKQIVEYLKDGELLVMFSGEEKRKTADEMYPFFADRSFVYLTGITQRETALVMYRNGDVKESVYTLPNDEFLEVWTGRRRTAPEITDISGVKTVKSSEDIDSDVHNYIMSGKVNTIYLCIDVLEPFKNTGTEVEYYNKIKNIYPHIQIKNIYPVISNMRKYKDNDEIEAIRKGMKITEAGIRRMMKSCKPGMMEYQLEAEFLHELAINGQREPAFPSIVAAGNRNFYLHYPSPMQRIEDGDLVLTDVGAPYDNYSTDISRVFPANGRFSDKQTKIYEIAYEANRTIMDKIKPGDPFTITNEICREVSFKGLKKLGIISDFSDIRKYVWHGVTHHIGLDTHDVGGYEDCIAENMVFTVDAGIYVREWGVGLRIEDNVLITKNGCENLSVNIPATISEIESLMNS